MKRVHLLFGALCAVISVCLMNCTEHIPQLGSNQEKPLLFFNRKPSYPTTGALDRDTMHWNSNTYYIGSDAIEGGAVQGNLIFDYLITANPDTIDRNNDGTIGYVLCIGDNKHPDSKARTEGIRRALGTWVGSTDPHEAQQGIISIGNRTFAVVELDAQEMIGENGTRWNLHAAKNAMNCWIDRFADQIDLVISNNDSMALGCLQAPQYPIGLPIFGYDAIPDALQAIGKGSLTGTVSQNIDAHALALLQILRNIFDGYTGTDVHTKGITEPNTYGNQISVPIHYNSTEKIFSVENSAITAKNYQQYIHATHTSTVNQTTSEKKKAFISMYSAHDFFMSSVYQPALRYYAPFLNIDLTIVEGDGINEASCLKQFTNLDDYDAYIINMINPLAGRHYTKKLQ
ncbi:MAG: substrate-binding domain-containing protein [Treponema sp.]